MKKSNIEYLETIFYINPQIVLYLVNIIPMVGPAYTELSFYRLEISSARPFHIYIKPNLIF
jgi:hypothetical protein